SNHDKLNTAVEHQRKSLQRRFEATVCDLAAELLEEISSGLLENLQMALRHARADLATGERSSEFSDLVEQWAVGEVPAHLVAAARADAFVDAMEQALDRSAPLVSISPDAHTAVHGDLPPHPTFIISEIPIAGDHRAAKRVIGALEAAGVDDARAKRLLNANS